MITTLVLLSGLATARTPIPPPMPNPAQRALYDAMKVRDQAPTCDSLSELSPDLATDLVWLVDNAQQPPWVGIRAAQCVIRHHTEAKAEVIDSWTINPLKPGLAILTIGLLDELPEPMAIRFASAALAGPLAEHATSRLGDSAHATVSALLTAPMGPEPTEAAPEEEATPVATPSEE